MLWQSIHEGRAQQSVYSPRPSSKDSLGPFILQCGSFTKTARKINFKHKSAVWKSNGSRYATKKVNTRTHVLYTHTHTCTHVRTVEYSSLSWEG